MGRREVVLGAITFAAGAFDYLPKPYDWAELAGVVDRALCYRAAITEERRAPTDRTGRSWLGGHSWAQLDVDGSALLGPGETFFGCVDSLEEVELPDPGQPTIQGQAFARLLGAGDRVHRVRAPLSGTVLEKNEALVSAPTPIHTDPFGEGWLVRIVPSHKEQELSRLATGDLDPIRGFPASDPT